MEQYAARHQLSRQPTQLTATVPASLITTAGTAAVSVVNPNGLASNFADFQIGSSGPVTIAQIADGASWQTEFQVINLDKKPDQFLIPVLG